nr:VOC family protein [Streptosporangium nondiastaticum]
MHYFMADDFDTTADRIRPHVTVVHDTMTNYDRTGREFFFSDPDGYLIGIFGPHDITLFCPAADTP